MSSRWSMQVWCCDRFLGEPVPVPTTLWVKNPFPMSSLNFPWCFIQFPCVLSLVHQREEISTFPSTAPFEEAVHSDLTLLFSSLNRFGNLSCTSWILPSQPFTILVTYTELPKTAHRIKEYAGLKGTHQDPQVQPLALCRTPQGSRYVPENIVQTPLELRQC